MPTTHLFKCGFKEKRSEVSGCLMTELQYLTSVPSACLMDLGKYISGPTDLHRLPVLMLLTAVYIIIHANTIVCFPSTLNLRTTIETLHLFNVGVPDFQKHTMLNIKIGMCCYILFIVGDIFLAKYLFFKFINFKLKQ